MGVQAALKRARREARANEQDRLPPWTPFERAVPYISPEKREALIFDALDLAERNGIPTTREAVVAMIDGKLGDEMWQNSRYTVIVFRNEPHEPDMPRMIHLSIRRNDRQRPGPEKWRDFQRIKNELVGPDHEGAELYPAEERVADCADQYHVFVFADPDMRFPFGFREGLRAGPSPDSPAAQTPFEE
jgi:hypothetical protein